MKYFDTHCHLQFSQYDADRDAVLAQMREHGVGGIVVGTDLETSKAGVELAEKHDFLWASVGLHPNDAVEDYDIWEYEKLAKHPKVVAIGECGLDYFRSSNKEEPSSAQGYGRAQQKERFEKQIELASRLNKPLIIHCRNAHDDCSNILQNVRMTVPVVMHFFTGTAELAQKYLDLGCYLSFPGPITYTDMYDESIRVTPINRILAETDAPFAAPVPYRGKRNEPSYVIEVIKKIATLKNMSLEEAGSQITLNSKRIFGLAK